MGGGGFFSDGPKFTAPTGRKVVPINNNGGGGNGTKGRAGNILRDNLLLVLTVFSVFIGVAVGFTFRQFDPTQKTIDLVGFPGELFMNILKALILPLIASSLVSGLSQLDARQSGRIGMFAMLYYAITMTLAVTTGICLVLIIHPGDPTIKKKYASESDNSAANVSAVEKLMDLLRNMFPENIVQASFSQVETEYVQRNVSAATIVSAVRHHVDGMDALGMIVFFIALGLATGQLGKEAKPLADLFIALDKVIIALVGVIMWYSPIGIASLIAAKILEINDLAKTAQMLALYVLTVVIGLLIQLFITLPAILFVGTRKNPYKFMRGLLQAAMTALGTASSAASLPVTFRCLEQINGVNPKYTKFVLPVGAMVNMDGTALYEAVASVFIAQLNGLEMSVGTVLTMAFTATLASIGAASIPSAGLVTMLIVLTAVGLPANDVTLIIAVDWLLDRLRTATNVMGDGMGCGFVESMVERRYGGGGGGEGSEVEGGSASSQGDDDDDYADGGEKQQRERKAVSECCWKTIDIGTGGDGGDACGRQTNSLTTVTTAMTLLNGAPDGGVVGGGVGEEMMTTIKTRH